MPVREIRNGRPVARRRVVREIRRMVAESDAPLLTVVPPAPETAPETAVETEPEAVTKQAVVAKDLPRHPRHPWRPRWTVLTAAVLLVAALATLAVTGQHWYQQRRLTSAHQAALAAARQTTVDFVSISAATVDKDLQRIAAGATGDFKNEFTKGVPQVRSAVVENKVASTGSVLRTALVSGDLDSAVVLVAVDANVKNTGAPDGRVSHYRIQVDLSTDPSSGRWLVSRLQFVG